MHLFLILLAGILTSFYIFPFEFTFLPGPNTKLLLGILGLGVLLMDMGKNRRTFFNFDFFILFLLAFCVSIVSYLSIVVNNTSDTTYVSYFISMSVWLCAAYLFIEFISFVHGYISLRLIVNYLVAVCVFQCFTALLIDSFPAVEALVDTFMGSTGYMGKVEGRLYGIGASLDVAGSRFSAVLVMIVFVLARMEEHEKLYRFLYVSAYFVITVIGNMIARTTIVGVGLSLAYLAYVHFFPDNNVKNIKSLDRYFLKNLIFIVPLVILLCLRNPMFYDNFRFAFEGFFSLVEKGTWDVNSNNILLNMYVFPQDFNTWLLGDGYFDNPFNTDPNYIGPNFISLFYMDTDVGYCRFLFYFGILGLLTFSIFMFWASKICYTDYKSYSFLFLFLLITNFTIWLKVSSDIFVIFSIFLALIIHYNIRGSEIVLEDSKR